MKKSLLVLTLVLAACSRTEVQPEAPLPDTAAAADSSGDFDKVDPLLDPAEEVQAVAPTPTPENPYDTPAATVDLATPAEPGEEPLAEIPEELPPSAPEPAPETPLAEAAPSEPVPETPPVVNMDSPATNGAAKDVKGSYELLEEQLALRDQEQKIERQWEDRVLIFHEGGAGQFGLDYVHSAFPDYDYDRAAGTKSFDTQGVSISWLYFPLRSHRYGRFGFGPEAAGYWTKFDTSRKHSYTSFGAKAVYEFQYWIGQYLVPHVSLAYQRVLQRPYLLRAGETQLSGEKFGSTVFGAGLSLNLNRLEQDAASTGLANIGVKKFYLAYTFLSRSDTPNSGNSHLLGLRFEY